MVTNEFCIRRAISHDVEILTDLTARTFKTAYESQLPSDELDRFVAATFTSESILEEMRDPTCTFLLADDDGKAVGYAMLREVKFPTGVLGPKPLELSRIYLEDQVIGRGYGSALMQACLEVAREDGYETLWLAVWEDNDRAIHFYKRWGFRRVGSQPFLFGSAVQTDLVMARSLR